MVKIFKTYLIKNSFSFKILSLNTFFCFNCSLFFQGYYLSVICLVYCYSLNFQTISYWFTSYFANISQPFTLVPYRVINTMSFLPLPAMQFLFSLIMVIYFSYTSYHTWKDYFHVLPFYRYISLSTYIYRPLFLKLLDSWIKLLSFSSTLQKHFLKFDLAPALQVDSLPLSYLGSPQV